jgi:hypothetical protein
MAWPKWIILPYLLLSFIPPTQSKNTGPSIKVSSSFDFQPLKQAPPIVPEDHIFYSNHQKNFSWQDPTLQERLWHGRSPPDDTHATKGKGLAKRAPTTVVGDAVFKLPSCLGCMRAQLGDTVASLDTLTRVFLQGQILIPAPQLQGRCVFYTGVQDFSDFAKRAFLPGAKEHPNLSKLATDWACANNKVTIWVSLNQVSRLQETLK